MKNKIKIILMFFVCFVSFFSVSNAEFSVTPMSTSTLGSSGGYSSSELFGGYTHSSIRNIVKNHINNPDDSDKEILFNTLVSSLKDSGLNILCGSFGNNIHTYIFEENISVGVSYNNNSNRYTPVFAMLDNTKMSGNGVFYFRPDNNYIYNQTCTSTKVLLGYTGVTNFDYYDIDTNIKSCIYLAGTGVSWDGESYYYQASSTGSEDSKFFTCVQNFYDSDLYKNSDKFKNFVVLYNTINGNYSFVGHNKLLNQYIYPANFSVNYKVDGTSESYPQDWWCFRISNVYSLLLDDSYYLYSTNDNGTTFTYDGKGSLRDLLDVRFSTDSIIAYANYDYGCFVISYDEDENKYIEEAGTIFKDTYIYYEDLDVTENGYNPLSSNISVNGEVSLVESPFNSFFSTLGSMLNDVIEIIKGILFVTIDKFFDLIEVASSEFGENFVVLFFRVIIKSVEVLVSGASLVLRFIIFILSFPSIASSPVLFSIDVAPTAGLSFIGLSWGSMFIQGLNFVKNLSWNGLGIWTLFEVFVASLEVVLFVKIVRKHYSH